MEYSSYLGVLLSVWVGLGLGQLTQSLHRLVRRKATVRWDWLPLAWAGFAFLMVVQTWWAYFQIIQSPLWVNLFAFLLPLAVFVILYLICASALPDSQRVADASLLDLGEFYFQQRKYFFGLWGAILLLALVVATLTQRRFDLLGEHGFRLAGVGASIVLIISGRRLVHSVTTVIAIVAMITYIVFFTLTLS